MFKKFICYVDKDRSASEAGFVCACEREIFAVHWLADLKGLCLNVTVDR